jgi:hypothetical protein
LFQLALAILKINGEEVMTGIKDDGELMNLFKSYFSKVGVIVVMMGTILTYI